jgi:fumarate hydratase class II
MGIIKRAAAEVNAELGLLDRQKSEAIIRAAEEIITGEWDDQFVVDPFQAGAGTSHHMNINEVLANRATQLLGGRNGEYLVHPNDDVNLGQSTNDTIPTAIRLGVLWRIEELLASVFDLAAALEVKAVEFDDVIKSGRTHLQDAVPVRLGQEFGAYGLAVRRDGERIERAIESVRRLGIGGTATGSGLNARPEYHARMVALIDQLTGLGVVSSGNLFESMQSMADLVDFSAAIRTLALTVTRIANDLRLLSSGPATGLDEIRLPAVQPGSSIMPGKVNPVMAEMANMAMFHVIGNDTTVALASQAGQLELNVMMPVIAHNLFEMMQVMIGALTAFTDKAVRGIKANPDKAAEWLEKNAILVTVLNPVIGYAAGAALVKESQEKGIAIRELALEKARKGALKNIRDGQPVTEAEVSAALDNLRSLTDGGVV